MPPLHAIDHWQDRSDEQSAKPKSTFFFIVEGSNTGVWYLDQLFYNLAKVKTHDVFKLVLVNREGEKDKTASNPKKLFEYAEYLIENGIDERYPYEKDLDEIVFVFDCDIYRDDENKFRKIVKKMGKIGSIGVTFPSFELFLLLHRDNAFDEYIKPNKEKLFNNKKVSKKKREIDRLFSEKYGFNPKKNEKKTRELAESFDLAVKNEELLNQDNHKCLTHLTSNVGLLINSIITQ